MRARPLLALAGVVWCATAHAAKTQIKPAPVLISLVGEGPVRALVAAGLVQPCDSPSNAKLLDTTLNAGFKSRLMVAEICFCVQASARGSTVLGSPRIVCRSGACTSDGMCAPVNIEITSEPP